MRILQVEGQKRPYPNFASCFFEMCNNFLGTSSAQNHLVNGSAVVKRVVPGKCCLFIAGWMPMLFFRLGNQHDRPAERGSRDQVRRIAFLLRGWSYPWCTSVGKNTLTAVCRLLEDACSPTAKPDLYREWALLLASIHKVKGCCII